jgi:hypothetical protein
MCLTKKITTAFCLLLLLAIPLLFSVTILLKQKIIHFQREERMDMETLQTLTLSPENIFWIKPGKEVLVNGKLFDVKSAVTEAGRIMLTGYFDDKEDMLTAQIVKLTRHKKQTGSPFHEPVINFLFFPVYIGHQKLIFETACWKYLSTQYYAFDEMIPAAPISTLLHPPC